MKLWVGILLALVQLSAFADTLTLRSGKAVEGVYLGGDVRQIRMGVGDSIEYFLVSDIAGLQFSEVQTSSAAERPAEPAVAPSTVKPAKVLTGADALIAIFQAADVPKPETAPRKESILKIP